MRRAFTFALCCLLLAGCATRGTQSSTRKGEAPAPSSRPGGGVPGPVQVVGRVLAIDRRTLSVIIELAPYAPISDYSGRILISRLDNLQPTARLLASPYLRGRTLGARLLAGQPQLGDEVVLAPETP